jgi:hypothetical protein
MSTDCTETVELLAGTTLFHYTRAEVAFEGILGTGLRFSSLNAMSDPLEATNWTFAWSGRSGVSGGRLDDTPARMRDVAKQQLKIVCMTYDDPGDQLADPWGWVYRGYARPRLWQEYADDHAGVCLAFRKDLLTHAFENELAQDGFLWQRHGRVDYDRWRRHGLGLGSVVSPHDDPLVVTGAWGKSPIDALAGHLAVHGEELLFTKLPDWATEQEYRYALLDDARMDRYLPTALVAIILGHKFPESRLAEAQRACEDRNCALYRMQWGDGGETWWGSDAGGHLRSGGTFPYVNHLQAKLIVL